ncbi:hypothetical protein VTH06DRAFT_5603 [Thermothelomyces fergusii]
MQARHFRPGWYCATPGCGYSRDSQKRDTEEIKKIRAKQARSDASSDADDELYGMFAAKKDHPPLHPQQKTHCSKDTDWASDERSDDSETDADGKTAHPESRKSRGKSEPEPSSISCYPPANPPVERLLRSIKGGSSSPVKTEPTNSAAHTLTHNPATVRRGNKSEDERSDTSGTLRLQHRDSRNAAGPNIPTRNRVSLLLSRIRQHADGRPDKSKWLEGEEELLEILRARKVPYRRIVEVSMNDKNHIVLLLFYLPFSSSRGRQKR